MFEVSIGGEKVEAEVSFWTARLYESEFMGDLIADFFGRQEISPGEEAELVLDFTAVNWNVTPKVLWAAVKTADESAPSFDKWLKKSKGMNVLLVREQLAEEIADCFFRAEAAEEDAEEEA